MNPAVCQAWYATQMRGRFEGSVYERKDGRWVVQLSLPSGQRTYLYRTEANVLIASKKEALRVLRLAQAQQDDGADLARDDQTVAQLITTWLESADLRPSTKRTYAGYVANHITPQLGRIAVAKLTAQQVQAFINRLVAQGLAPRTVAQIHAILRKALNVAMSWDIVRRNVAARAMLPRKAPQPPRAMSTEEVAIFLDHIRGDRLEALYLLALVYGLRQGELLGLRWSDIDFERQTIHINHALQKIGPTFQLVSPKTDKAKRQIPIPTVIYEALCIHRIKGEFNAEGLVFFSEVGTPLDGPNVTHRFQRLLREAGLERYRFHDLRHTAITQLVSLGIDIRTVSAIAGHSQVSTTLNVYSHAVPALAVDALERAADRLTHHGVVGEV